MSEPTALNRATRSPLAAMSLSLTRSSFLGSGSDPSDATGQGLARDGPPAVVTLTSAVTPAGVTGVTRLSPTTAFLNNGNGGSPRGRGHSLGRSGAGGSRSSKGSELWKRGGGLFGFGGPGGGVGGAAVVLLGRGCGRFVPAGKLGGKDAPKRVVIMMSDTGGGHRASAQAIKVGFEQLYGKKYETYSYLVKNAWMWRIAFNMTNPRIIHVPMQTVTTVMSSRHLNEAFDAYDPDLVISVHPAMQQIPITILKQRAKNGHGPPVPFATVVTDLTRCHNTWFHPEVDRCFVPTDEMKRQAKGLGLKDSQIVIHGLPIRPAFSEPIPPKIKLRKSLGIKTNKKTALLVGGGDGMGILEQTLQALSKHNVECQVVVICGRNKKLADKLTSTQWSPNMDVVVTGFVDNMHEWMSASDCIITKAGPGTIAESLICGLPLLLNGFVPCQEAGNVPYVTENHVGAFERKPDKIADILKHWFTDGAEELEAMSRMAKSMGRPEALFRIVEDLAAMAREKPLELLAGRHALAT